MYSFTAPTGVPTVYMNRGREIGYFLSSAFWSVGANGVSPYFCATLSILTWLVAYPIPLKPIALGVLPTNSTTCFDPCKSRVPNLNSLPSGITASLK